MLKTPPREAAASHARGPGRGPFSSGSVVVVTLGSPREKFWGMLLALAPEGLSMSGIDLASMEDRAIMVKEGEPFTPAVLFFPIHRIERIELDLPEGNLPSIAQRFSARTNLELAALLRSPLENAAHHPKVMRRAARAGKESA